MLTDAQIDVLALAAKRAATDRPTDEFAWQERDFWRRAVIAVLNGLSCPAEPWQSGIPPGRTELVPKG